MCSAHSPISPTVSLYCHSLNLTVKSTEILCNLIISPRENHSATRVTTLSIGGFDYKSSLIRSRTVIIIFLDPYPGCFRTFIPPYLMRSLKHWCKIFIKVLSLLCIICQSLSLTFCGLPDSGSREYMYSSSSRYSLCLVSGALAYASFTFCCIASRSARASYS